MIGINQCVCNGEKTYTERVVYRNSSDNIFESVSYISFQKMATSSAQSGANVPAQGQPALWRPNFQIFGNHVTDADTVLQSDFAALAVARNIVMPQDEITLAAGSDVEIANGSLILGIRATTALSNTARRLYVRNLEVQHLNQQLTALRQRVTTLTNEKKKQG